LGIASTPQSLAFVVFFEAKAIHEAASMCTALLVHRSEFAQAGNKQIAEVDCLRLPRIIAPPGLGAGHSRIVAPPNFHVMTKVCVNF
jgi:hypothetical protein